jgi:hypothetical protein
VATPELLARWQRTEAYLRDARSHLSEADEGAYADDIGEAEAYLEHNELGLALSVLSEIATQSEFAPPRVLELLALAAASMGMLEKQREIDGRLTRLRGWKYETKLPSE